MLRPALLAGLIVMICCSAACAGRRVALVIATADYENLRSLANPVNDARAVEDMLKDLGFEVWTETNRDLRRLRRALGDFREDGAGAEIALVFYAGHGVAIDGVNYILPGDADASSAEALAESALPLSELHQIADEISEAAIILLDACRDDPFAGSAGSPDGRGAVALGGEDEASAVTIPGLGRMGEAEGVIYAFAAAPGKTASDGSGANSPFTAALIRHFGANGTEIRTALTLVQQDVYDRSRNSQMPYIESGLPKLIYLSDKADLPERDILLLAMADLDAATRAEVELVAASHNMPLAPLYRAVLTGGLDRVSAEDRQKKLAEAASGYAGFQDQLLRFVSEHPRVAALRAEAEEHMRLGALETARALLDEAIALGSESLGLQVEGIISATLSLASTHLLNASVARTELRYDLAITYLTEATELYTRIRAELPDQSAQLSYAKAMADLGDLYLLSGNTFGALGMFASRSAYLEERLRSDPAQPAWPREMIAALTSEARVMGLQGYNREAAETYERARGYLMSLLEAAPDDPDLLAERAALDNRLGEVFFARSRFEEARARQEEALAAWALLVELQPDQLRLRRELAASHQALGTIALALGDYALARDSYDISLELTQSQLQLYPGNDDLHGDLALGYERLGDMSMASGDYDSALGIFNEALRLREALEAKDPANVTRQRDSALVYDRIGDIYLALNDAGSAMMAYQHALAMREALVALDPANALWQQDLSLSWQLIGMLLAREGDFEAAIPAFQKCRDLREMVLSLAPDSLSAQRELSVLLGILADSYFKAGDNQTAMRLFEENIAAMRGLVAADPAVPHFRADLAYSLYNFGYFWLSAGDAAAALPWLEEAVALREDLLAASRQDALAFRELSFALNLEVDARLRLGETASAVTQAARSVALTDELAKLRPTDPDIPFQQLVAVWRYGDALAQNGDSAAALSAFSRMARLARIRLEADPWNVPAARDYATALERGGGLSYHASDFTAAKQSFEQALDLRRWISVQMPDELTDHRSLAFTLTDLAASLSSLGEAGAARPFAEESLSLLRWIAGVAPENAQNISDLADGLARSAEYYSDGAELLGEAISLLEGLEAEGRMPEGDARQRLADYRARQKGG